MNSPLILSLFRGIGLLDYAFEQAWPEACIVAGPDPLWSGDIRRFHAPAGTFDGVIGGPPCKAFSRLSHMVAHNRAKALAIDENSPKYAVAENLIPDFVRVVNEAQPNWFLMENVHGVPEEHWPRPNSYYVHSFLLNNRWCADATPQNRMRRFWFGHRQHCIDLRVHIPYALFEPVEWEYAVVAAGSGNGAGVVMKFNGAGKPKRMPKNGNPERTVADYLRLQGLPQDFLRDSPFKVVAQKMMIGNGVPLPMGRALATAIKSALME